LNEGVMAIKSTQVIWFPVYATTYTSTRFYKEAFRLHHGRIDFVDSDNEVDGWSMEVPIRRIS
jgi:predicted enzyme related to lactoylglutathione lyase